MTINEAFAYVEEHAPGWVLASPMAALTASLHADGTLTLEIGTEVFRGAR